MNIDLGFDLYNQPWWERENRIDRLVRDMIRQSVRCDICGGRIADDMTEMYDPTSPIDADSVICHTECGLARGYEVTTPAKVGS